MLRLRNLTIIYPDRTKAIDDLSFDVPDGDSVALIGENGAGKTSLLLAVVGILEPNSGYVEVDGVIVSRKTVEEIRKRVGLVFQNPDDQLFMPYIYNDIAFGCRNLGLPEDVVKERVDEALKCLNIMHLRERSPLKLSGGEKRMAAIATVLAMKPELLMFDEPTAFLDPRARRSLVEVLSGLRHTKIVATHDMDFASQVCRRVIVLKSGRVVAEGDTIMLEDKNLMESFGL